jgi:hypothetical protein
MPETRVHQGLRPSRAGAGVRGTGGSLAAPVLALIVARVLLRRWRQSARRRQERWRHRNLDRVVQRLLQLLCLLCLHWRLDDDQVHGGQDELWMDTMP